MAAAAMLALVSHAGLAEESAKAKLAAISQAMGANRISSIEFTVSGEGYSAGQPAHPGGSFPRHELKSMKRAINYRTGAVMDEIVRANGENPRRGGGDIPLAGDQHVTFAAAAGKAWNRVGQSDVPAPHLAPERLIQVWLSPHGAIKGALAMNAEVATRPINGQRTTVISYGEHGKFRITAYADPDGMIVRVVGLTYNAVLGETRFDARYFDYADYGGTKFPTQMRVLQSGHPILAASTEEVRANVPAEIAVPESVKMAQDRVISANVADGVWYLTGGSHHSVVIEMSTYTIVVEAPLYDGRAAAVLAEAKALVPGKPVRYLVVTHDHFDHAGGARYFAAQGVTIISHDDVREFFARHFAKPARFHPDALARSGRTPKLDGVGEKRVIEEGARRVELYRVRGNPHSTALIMVYLPNEKMLIEADAFTPAAANSQYPPAVAPETQSLYDNVERLGLAVETILPIHGRMVPFEELKRAVGKAG